MGKYTMNSNDVLKEFNMSYKIFQLDNEIVMYKTHLTDLTPVPAIPETKCEVILTKYHDDFEAGHPRHQETYQSICRRILWVSMQWDITNYI